ncbi:hypothetical protein GQX73_g7295 [Xylaria multiplex]|uniref:Ecp2 effector protein domain-containing protein n=1 Tax=Xylaria multiplex TaxID=323545 RepID=A0A7C8IRD7_9PEZI|nr:hypothetical protein GQX73_g7295 [Xylaria multiplex]
MKVWSTLALLTGLSTAASIPSSDSVDTVVERRQAHRPYNFDGSSKTAPVLAPEDAPADFHTTVGALTENHSARGLIELPNELVDRNAPIQQLQRRDASKKPRGDVSASDFYECATTVRDHLSTLVPRPSIPFQYQLTNRQGNPPRSSDCTVVINNVFAANQATVIAAGACLLFQFNTCWGFFCSLCERLGTDTTFIGNQLLNAQTLCVNGGSAGTVVGEDAPEWEAGLIRANGQLPNYAGDVC